MTTLTRREAPAGAEPPATTSANRPSRFRTRRGSWGIALRMARRDVRRHKGRSTVVLLMVGIPTMLLVFGLTLYATANITGAERIPYEIGSGQASFEAPGPSVVLQSPDLSNQGGNDTPAKAIPGYDQLGSYAAQAQGLGQFLGGTVVPTKSIQVRVVQGERQPHKTLFVVDGRVGLGDKVRLLSGRWPANDGEILVTDSGARHGLAATGTVVISAGGQTRTVTVVGTVSARGRWGSEGDLVGLSTYGGEDYGSTTFILKRSAPVSWVEVQRLNGYGLTVLSAEVLRHPPSKAEIPADVRRIGTSSDAEQATLVAAGGAILLLVTTLLVGPAFAVSAARQRRTLALAASNGAETAQLRHTVLAQALVLGVLAALTGAVLGVLAVPPTTRLLERLDSYSGPFDVPWIQVLPVTGIAILSAIIAALVPARRLGRLDIVGVMRGQNVSPRLSRVFPVIGLVLAVVGGIALFTGIVASGGGEIPVVAGAVALILGTLFLVPTFLVLAARLASHLPVPLRMATRDAARQRTRSAPSVAAVVGAIAALTMMLIGLSSDTKQQAKEYQPQGLRGEGQVFADWGQGAPSDDDILTRYADTIRREGPGLRTTPIRSVPPANNGQQSDGPVPFVNLVPPGCTVEQTTNGESTGGPAGGLPTCSRYGSTNMTNYGSIATMPLADIVRRLQLDDAQAAKVRDGAVVVMGPGIPETVTFASGTGRVDRNTGALADITVTAQQQLPVVSVPLTTDNALRMTASVGVLATPETATQLGWPTVPTSLIVRDQNGGAISHEVEDRISSTLDDDDASFQVERGFHRADALIMGILVGIFAFLLLVITLTSTALSLAEQQTDDATLAAVGATRATRRAMAAAQALVVCLIGTVLGVVVGAIPGVAIAYPLTTNSSSCDNLTGICSENATRTAPTIDIPWMWLTIAVLGVPLVAAAISAVAVRRAPAMTRRAT